MSVDKYPPVWGPSFKQEQLKIFSGQDTDPSQFRSLHFSEEFKAIYGTPVLYYLAWERLMTVHVDNRVLPKLRKSFVWIVQHKSFLDYCKRSDDLACEQSLSVLTGRGVEGGWAQALVYKYDNEDVRSLIGANKINSMEDAMDWMRGALQRTVEKRFKSKGIEDYWTKKARTYRMPDWDVEKENEDDFEDMRGLEDPDYEDDVDTMRTEERKETGILAFRPKNPDAGLKVQKYQEAAVDAMEIDQGVLTFRPKQS